MHYSNRVLLMYVRQRTQYLFYLWSKSKYSTSPGGYLLLQLYSKAYFKTNILRFNLAYMLYFKTRDALFKEIINQNTVLCQCKILHTRQNQYYTFHTCSFACKEGMVNTVGQSSYMGCITKGSIFQCCLNFSCVKNHRKNQISMANTGVNSPHQEARNGALKSPSTQALKPQGGALITREEEELWFVI